VRRAEQARAGWLEQHADLPARERTVARELAWRGRVDARVMALDPPGWLLAELGPMPPAAQAGGRAAWLAAAVALDTWRRTHGLDERPAPPGRGQRDRPARAGRPVDRTRSTPATRPGRPPPTRRPPTTSPAPPRSRGGLARAGATPPRTAPNRHATRRPQSCWAVSPAGRSPAGAATGSRSASRSSAWPPTASAPATPTTTAETAGTTTSSPAIAAPSVPRRRTSATPGSPTSGKEPCHAPPQPVRPRRP
jgi:hypothetical protein